MSRSKLSYLKQIACAGAMVVGLLGSAHAQSAPMDVSKFPVPPMQAGPGGVKTGGMVGRYKEIAPQFTANEWYAFRCEGNSWYFDGTNYWMYAWDFDTGAWASYGVNSPFIASAQATLQEACRNGAVYYVYITNSGGSYDIIQVGD